MLGFFCPPCALSIIVDGLLAIGVYVCRINVAEHNIPVFVAKAISLVL